MMGCFLFYQSAWGRMRMVRALGFVWAANIVFLQLFGSLGGEKDLSLLIVKNIHCYGHQRVFSWVG